MGDELAAANTNRSYSLSATSIAVFTFMLFFMYSRFVSGEIDALLFQAMPESPRLGSPASFAPGPAIGRS
jgi:hypothetical protein